ncbi:acyl carrier protein [Streptomyces achromogenes]|uniref:acyl carrier protein n=1 Tax=Streptomyces achromogenes TaxID=67255 RepID=UPI003702713F
MNYDDLAGLLVRMFDIDPVDLSPGTTLQQLDLDSLASVELAVACNEQFNTAVEETSFTPEHRLADIVTLLRPTGPSHQPNPRTGQGTKTDTDKQRQRRGR